MIRVRTSALIVILALVMAAVAAAQTAKPAQAAKPAGPEAKLPTAILKAFQQSYPNATIKGSAKETENGKTVWEVESIENNLTRDLIYNPDGTVVEIEEQVTIDSLPAAVSAAVKTQYPKATITKAEKMTIGATIQYELTLKGAPKGSIELTPEGKPVTPTKK